MKRDIVRKARRLLSAYLGAHYSGCELTSCPGADYPCHCSAYDDLLRVLEAVVSEDAEAQRSLPAVYKRLKRSRRRG